MNINIKRLYKLLWSISSLTSLEFWSFILYHLWGKNLFTDSFFLQLINFSFRIPIFLGRQLGNTVAQYRWFLGVYIILMYFIFPLSFIAMSMIEPKGILTAVVTSLMVFMFACYMLVSFMRSRGSLRRMLPSFLMNWDFVPIWMRSLAPYDEYVLLFFQIPILNPFCFGCFSA